MHSIFCILRICCRVCKNYQKEKLCRRVCRSSRKKNFQDRPSRSKYILLIQFKIDERSTKVCSYATVGWVPWASRLCLQFYCVQDHMVASMENSSLFSQQFLLGFSQTGTEETSIATLNRGQFCGDAYYI